MTVPAFRDIDVAGLIDDRPISALQIRVFILCALVALLDGVDSQAIGVAGPLIAAQLKMSPGTFSWAYSAGLFGATIGALIFGPIADYFGRKATLIFATGLFGLFTCLTALADTFPLLVAYRFIAGLGLGGATPCFITLSAEYAPKQRRAMLVSLLWAGYPAGNAVGGFTTSYVVSHFPWQMVFYVAGLPTLVLTAALVFAMPESLRFLAAQGRLRGRAEAIASALDRSLVPGDFQLVSRAHMPAKVKVPLFALVTEGRAAGTILLWLILYLGFATTTVIVLQTPTLLRAGGMALSTTGILVGVYSMFAVCGMAIAGKLVEKFGPAVALAPAFAFGAVLLAGLGYFASSPLVAALIMALLGFTVPLGAAGGIALTAMFYTTVMRSSGVGWAMGWGRFGQVCSPLVIGLLLTLGWPPGQILAVMAIGPLLAALCVLLRSVFVRASAPIPDVRAIGEASA
jgi:AAHS family 4-hydroxybenzoate transporter-like MFS transporter